MKTNYLQHKPVKIAVLLICIFSGLSSHSGNYSIYSQFETKKKMNWMINGKSAFQFYESTQSAKTESNFRIDTHIHLYDTKREGSSVFLDPITQ